MDGALITLPEPFHLNKFVKPICLPSQRSKIKTFDDKWDGEILTIVGFGKTFGSQTSPTKQLQHAKAVRQNSEQCFQHWAKDLYDQDPQDQDREILRGGKNIQLISMYFMYLHKLNWI